MTYELLLTADGGIRERNPGGFGYGSFAVCEYLREQREYGHEHGNHPMTNIVAEILTCMESLLFVEKHVRRPEEYGIEVINDCQWVVKFLACTKWPSSKKPHLVDLHKKWCHIVSRFAYVKMKWLPREHSVALLGH